MPELNDLTGLLDAIREALVTAGKADPGETVLVTAQSDYLSADSEPIVV